MSIEVWMPRLARVFEEVRGMEKVYTFENIPGSLAAFPSTVIMPTGGAQEYSTGGPGLAWHDVQANVYTAGQFLPEALATSVRLLVEIRNRLAANITLGGSVSFVLPIAPPDKWYEGPGRLEFGDKVHTGLILRLKVKETEAFVVSA